MLIRDETAIAGDLKEEALKELRLAGAGLLDAAIDKLTKAKLELCEGNSVTATDRQIIDGAGMTECIFQELSDDPPFQIKQLLANIDVHDEVNDHEMIIDAVRNEWRELMQEFIKAA